jgi:FixJ family two-component response regulator
MSQPEKMRIGRTKDLTERERQVMESLIKHKNYKDAAKELFTSEASLRNVTYRIRHRVFRARDFVEQIERKQNMLPRKKRYFVD